MNLHTPKWWRQKVSLLKLKIHLLISLLWFFKVVLTTSIILTSNIVSSCCLLNTVPSSNTIDVFDVSLAAWLSHTSKKPNLIKISWSSWPKSQNPGTLFANSTTLWTFGVTLDANCWYNQHFFCSMDSAVEEASCISPSPVFSSGEAGGRMMGFRARLRVCSSVYLRKKRNRGYELVNVLL